MILFHEQFRRAPVARSGFTLIELLVVIAIIGILASLLLPVLGKSKGNALRAQCLSNLQQAAKAVQMYVDEHEQQAPGPSWTGQRSGYRNGYKNVACYIAPFLGLPRVSGTHRIAPVFLCPGFKRKAGGNTETGRRVCYIASGNWSLPASAPRGLGSFQPFGYPRTGGRAQRRPFYYGEIETFGNTATLQMFSEADQVGTTNPRNTWRSQLPKRPVHEDIRNYCYWDGHVDTKKVNPRGGYR